jgi:uncharacterized lipoprotein YmbA
MRSVLAIAVAAALLVTGCASESSADEFALEDAVECRELGGGWTFVRYERDGSAMQGVGLRRQLDADGTVHAEDVADEELEEATRLRDAAGWDDEAIAELLRPEAPPQLLTRLAAMPSCLDQLGDS